MLTLKARNTLAIVSVVITLIWCGVLQHYASVLVETLGTSDMESTAL